MQPKHLALGLALVLVLGLYRVSQLADTAGATVTRTYEGTVDYTGTPPMDQIPIHGYEYYIISTNVRLRMVGEDLMPELEGQRVRVTGLLIEDYQRYRMERGEPVSSADPEGEVLKVIRIDILN